jgi:hypothetical protein
MNTMKVAKTCPLCSNTATVEVRLDEFEAYQRGALVQDAFPTLTASEREVVKTGIHADCWDSLLFWSGSDED